LTYQVSTDKRSSITNDPNRDDDPEYILRLIGQVITVSLETVKIVNALPDLGLPQTSDAKTAVAIQCEVSVALRFRPAGQGRHFFQPLRAVEELVASRRSRFCTAGGTSTPSRANPARDGGPGLCYMCIGAMNVIVI